MSPPVLSVVIPTLNAAETLGAALAALPIGLDMIVVGGDSIDATTEIARAAGAIIVLAPRGRGTQLARGARRASAPWLLFCMPMPCSSPAGTRSRAAS